MAHYNYNDYQVYQVVCSNSNFKEWTNNIINFILSKENNNILTIEASKNSSDNKSFHINTLVVIFVSVVFVVISYIFGIKGTF